MIAGRRSQPLRGEGILLQEFAPQFQGGALISPGLNQHINDFADHSFAVMIDLVAPVMALK
jgi:hypothetical protein